MKTVLIRTLTLATMVGCASTEPRASVTDRGGYEGMRSQLLSRVPTVQRFAAAGPFAVKEKRNFSIRVNDDEVVMTDVFLSGHRERAPLVIFQHGNKSYKEAHRYQAMHVASWGMHAITVQQPNQDRWIKNGFVLGQLTTLLHKWPKLLGKRFDPNQIILVGHSFGGSAISIAAGMGSPVKGLILLDPAVIHKKLKKYLSNIRVPAVLLGADKRVFRSRRRYYFYKYIKRNIAEVSLRDATHDDAQFPSHKSLSYFSFHQKTARERQERFRSAITAAAFSFAAQGGLDYAWRAMTKEKRNQYFVNARRK